MGRPPAFLFVVRHGYRLDAADKQWHLSSPTPYDPPLTYSGWQQAKSLGVRINSILRERVLEDERTAAQAADPSVKPKRKRYEVVIHSSPFLRCIQTSIAISAGLAQDSTAYGPPSRPGPSPSAALSSGARPRPTLVTDIPGTTANSSSAPIRKSVLRLDAFLGEWLSPNYFEFITPPPESVMMLASAKADLLRREDYTHYPNFSSHTHSISQGQLWSPGGRPPPESPFGDGRPNGTGLVGGLANSLPTGSMSGSWNDQTLQPPPTRTSAAGYVSPVPHYAVSSNNTIPLGYVSHARDACVVVDYQWDSTRSSLDWGDGGTFPEEWSAMHKRFRAGVQSLVDWYSTAENPTHSVTRTALTGPADTLVDDDDVEVEAVVILVSHGAGCNALIGAVTHQPVLMDVGMASLTMAVCKPPTAGSDTTNTWVASSSAERSRDTPPIHQIYDLKLFANTDHLRSPVGTPTISRTPSTSGAFNTSRGRHSSFSTSMDGGFSWADNSASRNSSANAALGSFRRTSNNAGTVPRLSFVNSNYGMPTGSGTTSLTSGRPAHPGRFGSGSSGLWSPSSTRFEDDEEDDFMLPGFNQPEIAESKSPSQAAPAPAAEGVRDASDPQASTSNGRGGVDVSIKEAAPGSGISAERSPKPEPEQLGAGAGGLWGTPRPPDDADALRDLSGSKRRWTVTERS